MPVIQTSGALRPKQANTPLDPRTVVNTESDIASITLPYVGMPIYVRDTKKVFRVTELNDDLDAVKVYEEEGATESSEEVDETFAEGTTSAYDAMGISKGDDIGGKTAMEVLDMMLNAEFAPKWVYAYSKISIGKTLYYVGDSVPAQTAFTTSGSPASAQGKVTTTGGAVENESYTLNVSEGDDVTEDDDNIDFGSKVVSRGKIEVEYSRTYAASTGQVVSSKGNPTRKTASNLTTKLKDAGINTSIDTNCKIVKMSVDSDSDSNETAILKFTYPIYIDGSIVTNLTYDGNSYSKTKDIGVDGALSFEVPSRYTNIKVWYQNPMTKDWIDITTSCATTPETKSIGANNVSVAYTKLTYTTTDGSTLYKVTFTIA